MEEYKGTIPVYISAAKVILAAVGPAQRFVQSPAVTHKMINRQARKILYNDGYIKQAGLLDEFSITLDKGAAWADNGFKNMSHFYNPRTLKGIYGWTHAVRECSLYWNKAVCSWQEANYEKSIFYIGASIHLLQDLCVPHHAMGILFDGHQEYEEWVDGRKEYYTVDNKGHYGMAIPPAEWLRKNALIAVRYYHFTRAGSTEQHYHKATRVLLPLAQRSTAGFINCFLNKVGI